MKEVCTFSVHPLSSKHIFLFKTIRFSFEKLSASDQASLPTQWKEKKSFRGLKRFCQIRRTSKRNQWNLGDYEGGGW
jgi:hypothetical protein